MNYINKINEFSKFKFNIFFLIVFSICLFFALRLYHSPYSYNNVLNWEFNDKRHILFGYLFLFGSLIIINTKFFQKISKLKSMEFSINFKFSNLFIAFIFSLLVVATSLFSPNFFNNILEVH